MGSPLLWNTPNNSGLHWNDKRNHVGFGYDWSPMQPGHSIFSNLCCGLYLATWKVVRLLTRSADICLKTIVGIRIWFDHTCGWIAHAVGMNKSHGSWKCGCNAALKNNQYDTCHRPQPCCVSDRPAVSVKWSHNGFYEWWLPYNWKFISSVAPWMQICIPCGSYFRPMNIIQTK